MNPTVRKGLALTLLVGLVSLAYVLGKTIATSARALGQFRGSGQALLGRGLSALSISDTERILDSMIYGSVCFAAFFSLLSIGGLYIATEFTRPMLETDLRRVLGIRRDLKLMKKLRNHIVVCGLGRIGRVLKADLESGGATVVFVDVNAERVNAAIEQALAN